MLDAVKRYATKILLLHVVLLGLVLAIVMFAARGVYNSARQQATMEKGKELDGLADQTARGIENHYLSIMSDLDLILRDESDPVTTQPRPLLDRANGRLGRRFSEMKTVTVTPALTGIMWKQLRGRVSHLLLIENDTGRILASFPDAADAATKDLVAKQLPWFRDLKEPSMSKFQPGATASEGGYHLIAIPALGSPPGVGGGIGGGGGGGGRGEQPPRDGPRDPSGKPPIDGNSHEPPPGGVQNVSPARTVVAVVPIQTVKDRFFDPLNDEGVVNAALLDDTGQVLVSIHPELAGTNLLDELTPTVRAQFDPYIKDMKRGQLVLSQPSMVGTRSMEPRILAFEPIQSLPGRRWTILTTTPLSASDGLVNQVFKEALLWAIFLTISVTGVLVSTAFFMIRGRIRLERTRHELLTRELAQARQIQLAWLPDLKHVPAGLEIFAANLPASHISGDFYNWFPLPAADGDMPGDTPSKVAVVIGDVTGHGMAAAFLMATTQLLVRTTLSRYHDPGRCLREVNRQLCTQGFQGQFVTMVVMVLDPTTSSIEIAMAGHPAPLVEREGRFGPLKIEPQLVLGVDPHEQYKTEGFLLEPGSSVLLYTDGVVEAEAAGGAQYGVENLIAALKNDAGGGLDPESRIHTVLEDVKAFCRKRELHDDVTLVAIRTQSVPAVAATDGVAAERV